MAIRSTRLWPFGTPPVPNGRKNDEGAVALEFAILAPTLLFVVIGLAAMALYFTIHVALVHAATEGARASIGGLGPADRAAAAAARVQDIVEGYGPLIAWDETQVVTGAGAAADTYQVTVRYSPGDLGLAGFFNLWSVISGEARSAPTAMSYTVTVANGGYS